jgi:hypothetical protein
MKAHWRATLAVTLVLLTAAAAAEDDVQSRWAAARRYLAAVPVSQLSDSTLKEVAKRLPEDKRAEFMSDFKDIFHADAIAEICLAAMVKHFTADELNALADFYGSKTGASIMSKFPPYMADVMPPLQEELRRATEELLSKKKYRTT